VIYNIAERKSKIINSLLDTVKDVAIDCDINFNYNKRDTKCYSFPKGYLSNELSYVPNIEDEVLDADLHLTQKVIKWRGILKKINNIKYIQKPDTDELYDYDIYMKEMKAVLIGYIKDNTFIDIQDVKKNIQKKSKLIKTSVLPPPSSSFKGKVIKVGEIKYIQRVDTDELYDYDIYKESKRLKYIGKLDLDSIKANKNNGKVIKFGNKKYIQKVDTNEIYDYNEYITNKKMKLIGHREGNKINFI
jgi:hypothetical protein